MADPHINPATGVWDDNYYANLNKGSGGGGGGGYSAPDYASIAREQMKLMQEANAPVVASLQAQIPTIGAKFAQTGQYLNKQVSNLDERYKTLLSEITGTKTEELGRAEVSTSNELGRRGISTQGGLFSQTVNKALSPISRYYTGQEKELYGTNQAALDALQNQIAGLPIAQTEAEQALQTAIAQLQAGGNASAIQNALQIYQQQQSAAQAAAAQANALRIAQMEASGKTPSYTTVPQGNALVDAAGKLIYYNNKTYAGDGGGELITPLNTTFGYQSPVRGGSSKVTITELKQ